MTPEEAAANAIPVVTSFVLTAADKSRMYGACIVWLERLPADIVSAFYDEVEAGGPTASDEDVTDQPARTLPEVHAPEAICLLSRAAVFDALMECCRQLFRMRLSSTGAISYDALSALLTTTLPRPGSSCCVQLGNVNVPFTIPAANELPHTMTGRDFLLLFQALDVNNVIMLWALLLAEQKVVLQGQQPHVSSFSAMTISRR